MRSLVYYIGTTLDGFIAGPNGEVDFMLYPAPQVLEWIIGNYPETLPTHARTAMGINELPNRRFSEVLMGRATYEPALAVPTTSPYAHLGQHVLSSTLEIDDPAVQVHRGGPVDLVRGLKNEERSGDIWLCGGAQLAGQLASEVDELIIKRYPIMIGGGLPLFAGGFEPRHFELHLETGFADGTRISHWKRA